jgi:homogentisate 1,2-dioxygenase
MPKGIHTVDLVPRNADLPKKRLIKLTWYHRNLFEEKIYEGL